MAPLFVLLGLVPLAFAGHDYGQALSKSILSFEIHRSGYLPGTQRVQWSLSFVVLVSTTTRLMVSELRGHSGLNDGKANGVLS